MPVAEGVISEQEKLRRHQINESVIGTHAMEGIDLDAATLALLRRYETGELSGEQLSAEIDLHVDGLLVAQGLPGLSAVRNAQIVRVA